MNTKSKIALAAVLFAAIASPSFAGDQDLATLEATSGRITAQVVVPAGAYASAHGWAHRGSTAMTRDFQLQGKE
ncbi:MAG TPA: hypothetical protein VE909_01370 [Xanthobacteraceae bacterium]|nr:hypothetical protein [Xanthobacteraceae bacterium]